MIPQAIASHGPYADLWSHLKSMIHALKRAKNAKRSADLTDLDKDRLRDVLDLIKSDIAEKSIDDNVQYASLLTASPLDASYSFGVNLHQFFKQNPTFERWNATQKMGTEKKLQRLQSALENYLESLSGTLVNSPPVEELSVIQDVIESVLNHTESALQA